MKTVSNLNISNNASIFALFGVLFAVCGLIIARVISCTFAAAKVAAKCLKMAYLWFITPRTYFAGDGDGVTITGYQYLGINILVLIICFICCIKY